MIILARRQRQQRIYGPHVTTDGLGARGRLPRGITDRRLLPNLHGLEHWISDIPDKVEIRSPASSRQKDRKVLPRTCCAVKDLPSYTCTSTLGQSDPQLGRESGWSFSSMIPDSNVVELAPRRNCNQILQVGSIELMLDDKKSSVRMNEMNV